MLKHHKFILLTSLFIFVPFIESLLPGFFALNWHSPKKMYAWSEYFRIVKLVMVCFGITYFTVSLASGRLSQLTCFPKVLFSSITYIIALLQLPFLLLGLYVGISSESMLNYIHKEITIGNRDFYVYTSDPGAMGTASHQLYLKCPKFMNRYQLTFIERLDWIKGLELEEKDKQLLLKGTSQQESVDISNYHCD